MVPLLGFPLHCCIITDAARGRASRACLAGAVAQRLDYIVWVRRTACGFSACGAAPVFRGKPLPFLGGSGASACG